MRRSGASIELKALFDLVKRLGFEYVKHLIGAYLMDRIVRPGATVKNSESMKGAGPFQSISELSNDQQLYDAIKSIVGTTKDSKIHRVFGQMMLHASVMSKADKATAISNGEHMLEYKNILKALAAKKAGPVSQAELKEIQNSYATECEGGRKWAEIVEAFGGSGIVIVFVIAGKFSDFDG